MTTKRNKSKNNVTKKNFSLKIIPTSISSVYEDKYSDINNEKRLACFLANKKVIKNFAFITFYFVLTYWKKHTNKKWSILIKKSIIEEINDKTVLKIGFSENEYKDIVEFINKNDKVNFLKYIDDKFFKVTACLNNLMEPQYTVYHVDFNKNLQNIFIKELENLMLIKNIQWKDIKDIYNSLNNDKDKNIYNFFIFDIIYGADKSVDSIYRINLGNMNFFRERLTTFLHKKNNYIKVNKCNKSIINDENYSEYGIYNSTERYKITKKSPYSKIMNKYHQPFIGGPSGSTAVMYITLFQFYEYPFTYKNKILLLGMLIADYIPLWHTIPEILLSAYSEFKDKKIKKYNLNCNSVVYSINLLKQFIQ
jgi:hypothetical protein